MSDLVRSAGIRKSLLLALIAGCLGVAQSVRANVYASNIRLNGGTTNLTAAPGQGVTIEYILNEAASSGVTISVTAGSAVVRTIPLPPETQGTLRGANTVFWDGLDNSSNRLAGATCRISITARSSGYPHWTHLTSDDDPNTYVWSGRGIAVDRNAASPYFGRIFVANASEGLSPATTPGDVLGILKFNADGSTPQEGVAGAPEYPWPQGDLGIRKLEISEDDRLYVPLLRNGGELVSWDAGLSSNSFVQVLQAANKPFGAELQGLAVTGQGTNAQLWMADAFSGAIIRWNLSTNGACDPADPGVKVVGPALDNTGLTLPPEDVALDLAGNIYACQAVSGTADPTPRVFRFPAYDPSTNSGTAQTIADWAVGAGDDTATGAMAIAVDPTGAYVAVSYYGSALGGNGNTKVYSTANGSLVTNIDLDLSIQGFTAHQDTDCAWDAAGNLYYIDDFWGRWRAVSPPGPNESSTAAAALVEFTGNVVTPPNISGIHFTNGLITLLFSAGASDTPAMFGVFGAASVAGPYVPVPNVTFSALGSGQFSATFAAPAQTQFYKVDRVEVVETPPSITGIDLTNGVITLQFSAGANDTPGMFVVLSAAEVTGPFTQVPNVTITSLGSGLFRASFPASGNAQFYAVDRLSTPAPETPRITTTATAGGNILITFTASSSDVPAAFKLIGAATPGGQFVEVPGAAMEQLSPGTFKATAPTNGPIHFYRIQR